MAFFINFHLRKLEDLAADQGFTAATWKQDLLDDLLFDGRLKVEQSYDPKDPSKIVWHCKGRRASIAASNDSEREDALFCINIVAGPDAGGPRPRGRVFEVPGPWKIATMGPRTRPPVTVKEHLLKFTSQAHSAPSAPSGLSHSPFAALGLARSEGTPVKVASQPAKGERNGPAGPPTPSAPLVRPQPAPSAGPQGRAPVRPTTTPPLVSSTRTQPRPEAARATSSPTRPFEPPPAVGSALPAEDQLTSSIARSLGEGDHLAPSRSDAEPTPSPLTVPHATNHSAAIAASDGVDLAAGVATVATSPTNVSVLQEVVLAARSPAASATGDVVGVTEAPSAPVTAPDWGSLATALLVRGRASLGGLLDAPDPREARRQRIARLESELAKINEALASIPSDQEVIQADAQRRELIDLGIRAVPVPPPNVLCPSAKDLAGLLAKMTSEAAKALPLWVMLPESGGDAVTAVLTDASTQRDLQRALSWVEARFGGAPPPALYDLSPPATRSGDVVADLEGAWTTAEAIASASSGLPTVCVDILRRTPSSKVRAVANALGAWHRALSDDAFRELTDTLAAAPNPPAALEELPHIEVLGNLDEETSENLKDIRGLKRALGLVQRSPAPTNRPPPMRRQEPPPTGRLLEFGHPVTDHQGRLVSATLFVPPASPSARFVPIEVPIRLIADAPIDSDLTVTVTSQALDGVPKEALLPPGLVISVVEKRTQLEWTIPAQVSRWKNLESGRYTREEVVTIPVTLGAARDLRKGDALQDLGVRLTSGSASSQLKFMKFTAELPAHRAGTGLGDAPASELVKTRPLGAQIQHEKLEGVVEEGRHSFMVVAPRRFGKTTLFKHLAAHARAAGHHVVSVPLEREGTPEEGTRRVWAEIRRSLEDSFGSSPGLGESSPTSIRDSQAWVKVRRFVKEKGARSMVLLVDEAQVLVPRTEGLRWGNQFKTLVEMELSEPAPGLAVVQVGLFGTIDLSVRIGQNCRDFLLTSGSAQYDFDEASLARFLRQVGQGAIESSRAARFELARWTNNLRTLSTVFDQIRARLVNSQRLFMLDADVDDSIGHLLAGGQQLPEDLWNYARAELSHRDDPWDPIDAFPLAVAWARPEVQGLPIAERLDACLAWLNQELRAIGIAASVPPERAKAALADLRSRGVVRSEGVEFYRPLLRELLQRKSTLLRDDADSQLALMRLAVDTVVWPDGAQERGEGGQAKVFLADRGDRASAYRACQLDTDESRRRFARTCAAIRTLRDRRTNMPGDEHLPRVTEAGFRADDPSQGVIVYDWVEGETFDGIWGQLPPHGRGHIVKQLAAALSALHARDVLHCDVAPRNIIVNSRLEATLIDFGLARRADTNTHTRLPGDQFKAPEQCEENPSALKGSDVFALGVLLSGPNPGKAGPDPFADLIARMTASKAEVRPTAAQVRQELEELVDFEPALHQLQGKVEDVVADAPDALWDDLLQFKWQAAAAAGGFVPWDRHRAMEASFLLNNVFVRLVTERRGTVASALADLPADGDLSLAAVRGKVSGHTDAAVRAWGCPEVRAVGLLRIAWAHPKDRKQRIEDARRALNATDSAALGESKRAVAAVAKMLDGLIEPGSTVIRRFVGFFGV